MHIYIPSRSRADKIHLGTLARLPDLENVSVVVPEKQAPTYRHHLFLNLPRHVTVLECPWEGIAKTRHWIGLTAKRLGQPHFCMIDDDLNQFSVRIQNNDWHLRKADTYDVAEMLEWMEEALKTYTHCSISPRGNNRTILSGPRPLTLENVRTLRILAYQTDAFLSVEHGRVPVMEDFDVNLQLLEKGLANIQSYWWSQDQPQTASPGGCADYRDHALHEQGAFKLKELHSKFVKLRQKVNKGKVSHNQEFQTRTEVTIGWKMAYKHGVEAKKDSLERQK